MFNWLKTLFGVGEVDKAVEAIQPEPVKAEPKPKAVKIETTKKVSTKAPVKTEAKRGRKKAGVTKTDLNKMNKDELEAFAKKNYKIDLDKRRKKADLVDQVLALTK
jgi:nitric oxide reductase activation protein